MERGNLLLKATIRIIEGCLGGKHAATNQGGGEAKSRKEGRGKMEEVNGREREEKYMAWTDYVWCNFESFSTQNHISTNMWE